MTQRIKRTRRNKPCLLRSSHEKSQARSTKKDPLHSAGLPYFVLPLRCLRKMSRNDFNVLSP